MMSTAKEISRVKKLKGIFSLLALLNIYKELYPKDATVCDGDTYDYVVVGGGTAGVVVTARLVVANFSVLLIEAGGIPGYQSRYPGLVTYTKNSRFDWNYTSDRPCCTDKCLRDDGGAFYGKAIGGSGAMDYMIYGRGNPRDYEKFFEATGDPSWKWDNILKYFIKSEKLENSEILNSPYREYHGTEGNIGVTKEDRNVTNEFLEAYKQAGLPVVVDNVGSAKIGFSKALYHINNGVRNDASTTYFPHLKDNPKLHVTRNSLATKIIFNGKKAVGVEFVKQGKTITVKARKEVIVTAGPINSPQLLMLSGIGPKEELENLKIDVLSDLPVGKNLQCTVGTYIVFKTNKEANPGPFDEQRIPEPLILGYSAVNKCSIYPDYETQNFIIDDTAYFLQLCGVSLKFKCSVCDRLLKAADGKQKLVTILLNINPKSRGSVTLLSADPKEAPKIEYQYNTNEKDIHAMVTFVKHYMKIVETPYFKAMGLEYLEATKDCRRHEFGSNEYWKCYITCMVGLTGRTNGACSMGKVVDSELKVIGVEGLRVVGSTVMPNSVGGAIFAPEVALSEKAAEMIIANGKC